MRVVERDRERREIIIIIIIIYPPPPSTLSPNLQKMIFLGANSQYLMNTAFAPPKSIRRKLGANFYTSQYLMNTAFAKVAF